MCGDLKKRLGETSCLLLAAAVLAGCGSQAEVAREVGTDAATKTPTDTPAEPPTDTAAHMLINTGSLAERLESENLRILDVRPEEEYRSGHVPGAVLVPLDDWKKSSGQPGSLADAEAWGEKIGALGVGNDSDVVIYGGPLNEAARVWWLLKYFGHEQVRLLDGDWETWASEDRPIETEPAAPSPAKFTASIQKDRLAEIGQVKDWVEDPGVVVLDSRTRDEYTGKAVRKGNPRGGHLPGAVNLNWEDLRAGDGHFKLPKELQSLYATHGIKPGETVVTHCQSGGRGAAQAFAFELSGLGKAKNYYCSFREWSADDEAPVVEGE